jgi:hypothetical protein
MPLKTIEEMTSHACMHTSIPPVPRPHTACERSSLYSVTDLTHIFKNMLIIIVYMKYTTNLDLEIFVIVGDQFSFTVNHCYLVWLTGTDECVVLLCVWWWSSYWSCVVILYIICTLFTSQCELSTSPPGNPRAIWFPSQRTNLWFKCPIQMYN